jgi:2,3-dihydroxybenzoate decarboxylase
VSTGRYECLKPLKRKNQRLYARKYLLHDQRHGLGPAIMFARSVIGAERVLYAMDYPYQYVPEEVTAMERMPLTDPDKKAFFQTNAESVFRL